MLDVGCGNGFLLYNLSDYFNSFSGIEFSKRRAARTAEKLPNAIIYHGDFNSFIFENHYDVIVATDVIEHIPDIFGFFAKANECLDIGGYLVLSTPNIMYLRHRLKFLFGIFPGTSGSDEGMGVVPGGLYDGGHLHYLSFNVIRKMAGKYGFKVVNELGCGRFGKLNNLRPSITSASIGVTLKKIRNIKED